MPLPLTLRLSPRTPLQPRSFSVSVLLSPFQNANSKNLKSTTIRWLNQYQNHNHNQNQRGRGRRRGRGICICRAEISQDAPFAVAIGACMLSSLLFPSKQQQQEEEEDDDAAITPLIPDSLSWPSLASSPSSIELDFRMDGYGKLTLEASIRSGDMDTFTFFNDVAKCLGLIGGSKDDHYTKQRMHEERRFKNINLPSGKAQSRDEIRRWRVPRKPSQDAEHEYLEDKMDH